ncbi:P-loop NTPase fold protein [Collimonas silvisoli]|uniref:P-loop NTPase fold protein n=1 Tax=Collimonas silvisoli TaxID=2825884 RepID=UPI001B8D42B6|nr:P-loop NTPase fold protein [Collimonas silvisoli]
MTLKVTKEHLVRLLGEVDNSVIALSGKWGTGKTHLWNEVKRESSDDKLKKALYVSLFGQSSIDQVKRKLIESSVPVIESHSGAFDALKQLFRIGVKVGSEHYKALAAVNDLNLLLMAPVVLRNSVIVLDDIERKHDKLGIDEVLGFIDEYSTQYGSRFVLVLNDDQLANQELWKTFREKVIDQELKLATTPEEAFAIAIELTPSPYADALKRALISCQLTNIRIVGKVIKATNRILDNRQLDEATIARVVPSIVLFSAIYYRGLEDGPDFQFALNTGSPDWSNIARDKNKEPTEEDKRKDSWRLLMQDLGIHGCDEFEAVLVEFLESGLFDAGKIATIIDGYIAEKQNLEAREMANQFLFKVFWDYRVDDTQLVVEAAALPKIAGMLDPFVASELDQALATLPGGETIGKAIVDGWIVALRDRKLEEVNDDNPFNRPLHPAIKAEFAAINANAQARTTVLDACMHIIESGGWGTMQEVAMKRATAADFEMAIREIDLDKLRRFMRHMIEMRLQRQTYDLHFGTATQRFVEACRAIANDAASPRLAGLIKRLFERTAIASELALQEATETGAVAKVQTGE